MCHLPQVALRNAMLPATAEILGASGCPGVLNSAESIYDEAVISRNGWMMYGSKKPDEPHPWLATRVYELIDGVLGVRPLSVDAEHTPGKLAALLSIRSHYDETPLTAEGAAAVQGVLDTGGGASPTGRAQALPGRAGQAAHPYVPAHACLEPDAIEELVGILGAASASPRDPWIRVGIALKSLGMHHAFDEEDRYLDAFLRFSRRGTEPRDGGRGYTGDADAVAAWRTLCRGEASKPADKLLTAGTLRKLARDEDEGAYDAWVRRWPDANSQCCGHDPTRDPQEIAVPGHGADEVNLLAALKVRFPDLGLDEGSFRIVSRSPERVEFEDPGSGVSGHVEAIFRRVCLSKPTAITQAAQPKLPPAFAGLLHRNVPCQGTMTDIHSCVPLEANLFLLNQDSEESAELRSVTPGVGATLTMHRPHCKDASVSVTVPGKPTKMATKTAVATLTGRMQQALERAGEPAGIVQLFVNEFNGTLINNFGVQSHAEPLRTDEGLVNALLDAAPDLRDRIKFAPASKTGTCNGLYCCDPNTSVWEQQHNVVVEAMLVEAFQTPGLNLDAAERRHVESRRGRGDMRTVIGGKVVDDRFLDRLDANVDIFAVANGCFDSSGDARERPRFRPLTPEDCVSITTGWSYDGEAARLHRAEVDGFFEGVLPIAEERRVVLAYFARLLTGRRTAKKFLAFTDDRSGDNGKSMLMKLFQAFFGRYADVTGTKFVCRGSFDRDRNSHDAGTEMFRGKRIVIAEELKHTMTLDEGMLKRLAGGAGVTVGGRRLGTNDHWQFTWQAGFAMIFNEGDMPKFDHGDAAFVGRMIAVLMRSKFVTADDPDLGVEPWTYPVVPDIEKKFEGWLPAVMDVLLDHFADASDGVLDSNALPAAMREIRHNVVSASNPVAKWCEERLQVTGNPRDYVILGRLKGSFNGPPTMLPRFAQLVAACYEGVGGTRYRSRTTVVLPDGTRAVGVQDVLWGVVERAVR